MEFWNLANCEMNKYREKNPIWSAEAREIFFSHYWIAQWLMFTIQKNVPIEKIMKIRIGFDEVHKITLF